MPIRVLCIIHLNSSVCGACPTYLELHVSWHLCSLWDLMGIDDPDNFRSERAGDVKKEKTLQPGHSGWAAKAAYLEAMSGDHLK